jgi:uncharacterized repeat protein (TIGR01451 family)
MSDFDFTIGKPIHYTITVQNNSDEILENITIKDFAPENMIIIQNKDIQYVTESVVYGVMGDSCYADLFNNT